MSLVSGVDCNPDGPPHPASIEILFQKFQLLEVVGVKRKQTTYCRLWGQHPIVLHPIEDVFSPTPSLLFRPHLKKNNQIGY